MIAGFEIAACEGLWANVVTVRGALDGGGGVVRRPPVWRGYRREPHSFGGGRAYRDARCRTILGRGAFVERHGGSLALECPVPCW
jgi:hypothetical protein